MISTNKGEFPQGAVTALPTFYRTYSRVNNGERESWKDVCYRNVYSPHLGLAQLGKLTKAEAELIFNEQLNLRAVSSGRWLWCGGTIWLTKPNNWHGAFNCSSTQIEDPADFGRLMNLAMMGVGTGAVLTGEAIAKLPSVHNSLKIMPAYGELGSLPKEQRTEDTKILPVSYADRESYILMVGDSREGWVSAYQFLINCAMDVNNVHNHCQIVVDVSGVRPNGEVLSGFGGVANPDLLPELFTRTAEILNEAVGRNLNSLECCLLIDEAARVIVAGGIRRTAGMRQFDADDSLGATAKLNLWTQTADGSWKIDPKKQALTNANHTRVYWQTPTLEEIKEAVELQFQCGEGAIMYAPEALWRANRDIFPDELHSDFLLRCEMGEIKKFIRYNFPDMSDAEVANRVSRIGMNPCFVGETLVKVRRHTRFNQPELVSMKELADSKEEVFVRDLYGNDVVTVFRKTGTDRSVVKLSYKFEDGVVHSITCTPDHKFYAVTGTGVNPKRVCNLQVGDLLRGSRFKGYASVVSIEDLEGKFDVYCCQVSTTHSFDLEHLHTHNCGEEFFRDNHCNLYQFHADQFNPFDLKQQHDAIRAATIGGCALLHKGFEDEKYQISREFDPRVQITFTGLFDFFVNMLGVGWLEWWQAGRPDDKFGTGEHFRKIEREVLERWRTVVNATATEYCQRHGLKRPNRLTGVQPSGTKALLTGASPGWHPPKAQRFLRRITFAVNDPVALACIDYGYSVIPGQKDKDENGVLLNDPFDPRVTEWLVEIPTKVGWADLPGVEDIDISKFSALAQLDFFNQVQTYWTDCNTSSTIELEEHEIDDVANWIHDNIKHRRGYISTTLLRRFEIDNQTFPRLPFEPISEERYKSLMIEVENRRIDEDFHSLLSKYDTGWRVGEGKSGGCDGLACEIDRQP